MKFIFKIGFGVLVLTALWFLGQATAGLWLYSQLDRQVAPKSITWSIRELSPSSYRLEASYLFEDQDVEFTGESELDSPQLLNRYAAEKELSYRELSQHLVWYSSSHPHKNALQKIFPYKACFQALVTLGLVIYFFLLKKKSAFLA